MKRVGEGLWCWGSWDGKAAGGPAPAEASVLQLNLCGSACHAGDVGKVVRRLQREVVGAAPDLILLNEICLSQADALWAVLEGGRTVGSGAFAASTGRSKCPGAPGERWFGNAVLSRAPGAGSPWVAELPNLPDAPERRNVVAMTTTVAGRPIHASCTHLTPRDRHPDLSDRQLAALAHMQNELLARGAAVLFGGDLNAVPEEVHAAGGFTEGFFDLAGEHGAPTHGARRIDYLFVDRQHAEPAGCRVTSVGRLSDHRLLSGRVVFGPVRPPRL